MKWVHYEKRKRKTEQRFENDVHWRGEKNWGYVYVIFCFYYDEDYGFNEKVKNPAGDTEKWKGKRKVYKSA